VQNSFLAKKVKYVDLYSASSRSTSNVLPLPISRQANLTDSQAFNKHCETMDTSWCIMRYACFLPQLTPGTHSAWAGSG